MLNPSWIIFGEGFRASQVERWLERGFDLVAGCVLLMLALPITFPARLHRDRGRLKAPSCTVSDASVSMDTCSTC